MANDIDSSQRLQQPVGLTADRGTRIQIPAAWAGGAPSIRPYPARARYWLRASPGSLNLGPPRMI